MSVKTNVECRKSLQSLIKLALEFLEINDNLATVCDNILVVFEQQKFFGRLSKILMSFCWIFNVFKRLNLRACEFFCYYLDESI